VPAWQINDAEAAHPNGGKWGHKDSVFIRAAMLQRPHHPARNLFGLFGPLNPNDAANSTHSWLLYRERQRSSTLT
jgi:hypothetical protein